MDDELLDDLDSRLTYGDTRSEYVRNAIRLRIAIGDVFDEEGMDLSPEEEREYVVEAVEAQLEQE
jgi:metal-responsive CopG/Arc/MetJ family transcriptional regulator